MHLRYHWIAVLIFTIAVCCAAVGWLLFRTTVRNDPGVTTVLKRFFGRVTTVETRLDHETRPRTIWFFNWLHPFDFDRFPNVSPNWISSFYGKEIWQDVNGDGNWDVLIINDGANDGIRGKYRVYVMTFLFETNTLNDSVFERIYSVVPFRREIRATESPNRQ